MNQILVKDYIFQLQAHEEVVKRLQNNFEASYHLIFDADEETNVTTANSFQSIKQLVHKKQYSVTLKNTGQIDFIIDLIGDNKNIHTLAIDSQILNCLLQTKLYLIIFPLLEQLYIKDTVQNVTNDIQIEKFNLKMIVLEKFDPEYKQEYSSVHEIISLSEKVQILGINLKRIQQLGVDILQKHVEEIIIFQNTKGQVDTKQFGQCIQILSQCNNIKKITFNYNFQEKTLHLHQQLQQLDKDIYLNLQIDTSTNIKQLSAILKQNNKIKEITYNVQQKLNTDNFQNLKFFDQNIGLQKLHISSGNKQFTESILEQLKGLKNKLTSISININTSNYLKYLIQFLENNTTLKELSLKIDFQQKFGRLNQDFIQILQQVKSLQVLQIQLLQSNEFNPNINQFYEQLSNLNIKQLALTCVHPENFITDNVIQKFSQNKSLAILDIKFYDNSRITPSQVESIYEKIQMKSKQNLKVTVYNHIKPYYKSYINNLMNIQIDKQIIRKVAFNKYIAEFMTYSPEHIFLDLSYDD
ncbi:hypothetical protein TTHERM_00835550 (macronuclear) [Tetrahymena thermophila SB210]|uniref:Uncharacterized protein n=1 Tax=Tetrahymena thermophila (strain SB210) TaxID=312017 RepID=Q22E73_TETTS|nr:hypothetical protein TTHERM_00835550 [Tetrahymena thermophila SB210]EAR83655.1 hypothetical protein TTHERM_00835550 [Tetrahymena thermophila SB210]|eukprot:XP_001031318.1 hypothetical protein TTHERM_00835550 [Tetrahymena thermophila SB210]